MATLFLNEHAVLYKVYGCVRKLMELEMDVIESVKNSYNNKSR